MVLGQSFAFFSEFVGAATGASYPFSPFQNFGACCILCISFGNELRFIYLEQLFTEVKGNLYMHIPVTPRSRLGHSENGRSLPTWESVMSPLGSLWKKNHC
jgi:hypothetical protein